MKNYEANCLYCGKKIQSTRKDAKYCSNSCRVMASRERKQNEITDKTSILVKFSDSEYSQLGKSAKSAGISVPDMVKYRSLLSLNDIESKENEIAALKEEIIKLKAHLSVYTKKPAFGIFLAVDKFEKEMIADSLYEIDLLDDEEDPTLEDQLIYLGKNCSILVEKK